MRKILLLMLSLVMVTMVKAEGVTPQQALEQARNFIQKRENNGSRPRRAPGTAASRLVMAKQVNGLYVFKMAKNEGFVI
ncbi:MAG: Spi family protease inhibitor, partial [Prevotella sp.]|nr:Spi family protease inhibitor [Prevotella sp.]